MKGYKRFIFVFAAVLVVYVLAEMNRPKPLDWSVTLSKEDKNPYGGYILYHQLKDLFPRAGINSYRSPMYDQVNNSVEKNTAYLLIDPSLELSGEDINELLNYVVSGNYVFITAGFFNKAFLDSLQLKTLRLFDLVGVDSTTINFSNPVLRTKRNFGSRRMTIDGYFESIDTAHAVVLGTTQRSNVNFIKMPYGEGAIFIHASPLCFSNYFMLKDNNAEYTAKALSYIPRNVTKIYWDEYYKLGRAGSQNPLRFILTNVYLKWAFRIALLSIILFVLFEMKRRQRIIPVIGTLRNSTLDFVRTVGNVYFNQRDNKNIAIKKINYFLEFVRADFYLSTTQLNEEFTEALAKKSGMQKKEIEDMIIAINEIHNTTQVSDQLLLDLNKKIDDFYANVK